MQSTSEIDIGDLRLPVEFATAVAVSYFQVETPPIRVLRQPMTVPVRGSTGRLSAWRYGWKRLT